MRPTAFSSLEFVDPTGRVAGSGYLIRSSPRTVFSFYLARAGHWLTQTELVAVWWLRVFGGNALDAWRSPDPGSHAGAAGTLVPLLSRNLQAGRDWQSPIDGPVKNSRMEKKQYQKHSKI